jgi:glucose-6-phosphate isomerase
MEINLDLKGCLNFIDEKSIYSKTSEAARHLQSLIDKDGRGNDFLGWLNVPDKVINEIGSINQRAEILRQNADITVIIGIGGSYLGSKSVIEAIRLPFKDKNDSHEIIFAGQNISEVYLTSLLDYLHNKKFNLVVISKSGTTTEPAIAFRLLRKLIEKTEGEIKARERIVAVTDSKTGALRQIADKEGYKTFIIPDDIGGRYSVLTPVGLLPMAIAGINIEELLKGAISMAARTRDNKDALSNPALVYAAIRNILYNNGKKIELLVNFEPGLHHFAEWWKQLFGESEGKEGKGIFPAAADMTTDLHSMGQYIQDGERILFETVISVNKSKSELVLPEDDDDLDKLNYIKGRRISEINSKAEEGTIIAHIEGQVPVIKINLPALDENSMGQLIYFFEISCGISGYILGINPFNQPGVEAYKKNMYALLGK